MSSPAYQIRSRVPRIAEAAVERARLRVVPRRRVRAARVPFVSLVSVVLLLGVVGLLLFNTSMQQASFAATALEGQAGTLSAREQTLRMELDVLRNPQRVAEQARRMGMVDGAVPVPIDLRAGTILAQPATGTATKPLRINPLRRLPAVLDPAPLEIPFDQSADSGASTGEQASGAGRNEPQQQQGTQKPQKIRN